MDINEKYIVGFFDEYNNPMLVENDRSEFFMTYDEAKKMVENSYFNLSMYKVTKVND